jgi:UDP-N-acetylmuramate dehydrogenase
VAPALRGDLRRNEPMARHVSWRAGGAAACAYRPADLADLAVFLAGLPSAEPICFVGLGSNLLVRDGGYRGTVVFTHAVLKDVGIDAEGVIRAEAGVASPKVSRFAAMHDRTGAEFLAGIPGTIGGALAMNAGCYGAETWDTVAHVETIDRSGVIRIRTAGEYDVGYRHVALRGDNEEWFVAGAFRLHPGDGAQSRLQVRELLARRIATQPLGLPNAGSVFRNPPGDFAARLIEAAGLKGHRIGGASISAKHANFIVNDADARAGDIEALMGLAQDTVLARFGITLEREVRVIGETRP